MLKRGFLSFMEAVSNIVPSTISLTFSPKRSFKKIIEIALYGRVNKRFCEIKHWDVGDVGKYIECAELHVRYFRSSSYFCR